MADLLGPILARKARENVRRRAHLGLLRSLELAGSGSAGSELSPTALDPEATLARLRRARGAPLSVIAEIKFSSPSMGPIHPWSPGEGLRVARSYQSAGARALSVLCDHAGFGGNILQLRRIARAIDLPVLFKEFVLDEVQLDFAERAGASMVLLLVRALSPQSLQALVDGCQRRGLVPVVEAANGVEVVHAVATGAQVIGVNARDLSTFAVDPIAAASAVEKIPADRVAIYMSGVSDAARLQQLAQGRADAALVGTGLMRHADPGARLAELLRGPGMFEEPQVLESGSAVPSGPDSGMD